MGVYRHRVLLPGDGKLFRPRPGRDLKGRRARSRADYPGQRDDLDGGLRRKDARARHQHYNHCGGDPCAAIGSHSLLRGPFKRPLVGLCHGLCWLVLVSDWLPVELA